MKATTSQIGTAHFMPTVLSAWTAAEMTFNAKGVCTILKNDDNNNHKGKTHKRKQKNPN